MVESSTSGNGKSKNNDDKNEPRGSSLRKGLNSEFFSNPHSQEHPEVDVARKKLGTASRTAGNYFHNIEQRAKKVRVGCTAYL